MPDVTPSARVPVTERLRVQGRRFAPVVAAMLVSQATAAAALLALPLLGAETADLYAVGVQAGNSALAGPVIGVLYMLVLGRPSFRRWRAAVVACAVFSLVIGAVSARLFLTGTVSRDSISGGAVWLVLALFGVGGAFLAWAGVEAVRWACLGRPRPLAAVAVLPNICLAVAVLVTAALAGGLSGGTRVVLPAAVWAAGAVAAGVIGFLRRAKPARDETGGPAKDAPRTGLHAAALSLGVVVSTVLPTVLITAMAQLPPGTTIGVFLVLRVGTAFVGLGVNAVLMVEYSWTSGPRGLGRAPRLMTVAAAGSAVLACAAVHGNLPALAVHSLAGVAWLIAILAAPVVMREVNARGLGGVVLGKVLLDLGLSASMAALLWARPSVAGYFGAYVVSQGVSIGVPAAHMRSASLGLPAAVLSFAGIALVAAGG